MRLDLKALLLGEGVIPFAYALEPAQLDFPSIVEYRSPLRAEGRVSSKAGILTLTGTVSALLLCRCDRCGSEYERELCFPLDTTLVDERQDEEDPDVFLLEDGGVDLDEVVNTAFVLGLDSKMLCRPDCKGVCPRCGRNLNDGPCGCKPEPDSRLAVLEQLLDQD